MDFKDNIYFLSGSLRGGIYLYTDHIALKYNNIFLKVEV